MQPELPFFARVALVTGLLLAAGALLLPDAAPKPPANPTPPRIETDHPAIAPHAQTTPPSPAKHPRQPADQPALISPSPDPANPPHPDAIAFGSDAFPPEREPELLLHFLEIYRGRFRQFPTAEDNPQMMNALRGANPDALAIFPADHPRLDAQGALLDAWDTPFFFHHLSRDHLEVRSAGPDRELFTTDDLISPRRPTQPFQSAHHP
ncbi:MAG: hypothetical protein KJ072_02410 [Verrucomicrobia bacterium]|nr:hypothetical protein [Verrucomicrobiota bacterium]